MEYTNKSIDEGMVFEGDVSLEDGDLAELVRKSWSEPQETINDIPYTIDSPISSAIDSSLGTNESSGVTQGNDHIDTTSIAGDQLADDDYVNIKANAIDYTKASNSNNSEGTNGSGDPTNRDIYDYQLFKRHYSLADTTSDALTEIWNNFQLDNKETTNNSLLLRNVEPLNPPLDIEIDADVDLIYNDHSARQRKGSIVEVQWVRQLLNPRSSFSGVSQYSVEPDSIDKNKLWVTIIDENTTIDIIKSIIVLHQSLRQVNSRFEFAVLNLIPYYTSNKSAIQKLDLKLLNIANIRIIDVSNEVTHILAYNGSQINPNISKLALFLQFINDDYELICYLSPTLMVTQNIDELLCSEEICDKIDNETCVLLTNNNVDLVGKGVNSSPIEVNEDDIDNNELDLVLFRPISEVGMCVKEYFTCYGNEDINHQKLMEQSNSQILKQLFAASWQHLNSDGYLQHLTSYVKVDDINCKILDYRKLKPWNVDDNTRKDILHNPLYGHWYHTWYNSMKR
ncbi:hypothetical protein TPHA_0A02940 [Tetrapisispora phaffii CBS 4417]|uniref:Uncharacterized protein n=1 Tax=Tetrapisispora phaffii (strain ATCC 24235 / CBS 4417 / NBRC 1672 / NRRL Y-8282 / UCD 70-5) TaxID=1071381 RepID=G8BN96_TETPH|nr:hypothetical protein TPHA_0A02940 [Tetrapisispora phaffii CBS 4417]CCE61374.1 hypothetical protein TPHA_0A02940 [Tetrapisispora phaffii CBS 4417]